MNKKPILIIIPENKRTSTQKPITSFARKPATARAGNAQKGWIIFVQASPHAIAIAVFAKSAFNEAAASNIIGACTDH